MVLIAMPLNQFELQDYRTTITIGIVLVRCGIVQPRCTPSSVFIFRWTSLYEEVTVQQRTLRSVSNFESLKL